MSRSTRTILISCYFPRSVEIEGVGSLATGLARHLAALRSNDADGGKLADWRVRLLLPEGQYKHLDDVNLLTYKPGIMGMRRYKAALAANSADADIVLMLENSPTMAGLASASRCPGNTFCLFLTPLQGLGLIREMGLTRQAVKHVAGKNRLLCRLHRWSGHKVIVASQYQARQLLSVGATDVHVIPVCRVARQCAIPSRTVARQKLQWDDRPVVGYLGHYSVAKGVDVLVDAFGRCDGQAVLALAHSGKGRLSPSSQRILERLRAAGRVREVGTLESPTTFLAACDAVALPYVTGSVFHHPQVLLESFASSTAVVTSAVGGVGEMLLDGRTGSLVSPRDPGELAAAITGMLADLPSTHAKGVQARRLFEQECCLEVFIDRLLELAE